MTLSRLLPSSLPPSAIDAARRDLETIVRRLVPQAADFCLVHVVSRGAIRPVAWAHATADGDRMLHRLTRRYRISINDGASGVASVLRTGRPLLRTAIQIEVAVARHGDAAAAEIHRQLAPRSAVVVPIATPHAVLGALTLCFSHSGRTYSARHIPSTARVAARMARALVPRPASGPGFFPSAAHARGSAVQRRPPTRS